MAEKIKPEPKPQPKPNEAGVFMQKVEGTNLVVVQRLNANFEPVQNAEQITPEQELTLDELRTLSLLYQAA